MALSPTTKTKFVIKSNLITATTGYKSDNYTTYDESDASSYVGRLLNEEQVNDVQVQKSSVEMYDGSVGDYVFVAAKKKWFSGGTDVLTGWYYKLSSSTLIYAEIYCAKGSTTYQVAFTHLSKHYDIVLTKASTVNLESLNVSTIISILSTISASVLLPDTKTTNTDIWNTSTKVKSFTVGNA